MTPCPEPLHLLYFVLFWFGFFALLAASFVVATVSVYFSICQQILLRIWLHAWLFLDEISRPERARDELSAQ